MRLRYLFPSLALLCLALHGGRAGAEVTFDFADYLETRFGTLGVVGESYELQLAHDGAPLPLPVDARWWVQWSRVGAGPVDWALAFHHHGGNACGGGSYLLRLGPEGVEHGRPISDCDGRIVDIRTGPDWIELDRTDRDIFVTHVTVRWQGDAYSETFHYAAPSDPAGAGEDVTRWIGQPAWAVLQDPGERARFAAVMRDDEMQALADRLSVSRGMERVGDWVIATGCMPHACGVEMGAIGIRIGDGAVAAIVQIPGMEHLVYGLGRDPAFFRVVAGDLN